MARMTTQQDFFRIEPSTQPLEPNPFEPEPTFTLHSDILGSRKPRGRGSKVSKPWDQNVSSFSVASTSAQTPARTSVNSSGIHFAVKNAFPTPETPSNTIEHNCDLLSYGLESPSFITGIERPNTAGNGFSRELDIQQTQTHSDSLHATMGFLDLAQLTPNIAARPPLNLPLVPPFLPAAPTATSLLSPLYLDFDHSPIRDNSNKENIPMESSPDVPRLRKKALSKIEYVKSALSILQQARITPAEFLTIILDDNHQEFYDFRTAFYAEKKTRRFEDLLEMMWSNDNGARIMKTWFQPHAVDLVCEIIHQEMDAAKPYLQMSTNEVTTDFISSWDINGLMEPIAETVTPVWSRILDAATETKDSKDPVPASTKQSRL